MSLTLILPDNPYSYPGSLRDYVGYVNLWARASKGQMQAMVDAINAGGGIPDAPSDGHLYGRKNAAWSAIAVGSTGNLTEAVSSILTITGGTGAVNGSGTSIAVTKADGSHNGYLSSTDWTAFNGKQSALTLGNFTEATSSVLTITGGTGSVVGSGLSVQVTKADASHNGYLSSTDWNTFSAGGAGATDVLKTQVFS